MHTCFRNIIKSLILTMLDYASESLSLINVRIFISMNACLLNFVLFLITFNAIYSLLL